MPITDSKTCPQCGAPLEANVTVCKYCGSEIVLKPQFTAPQPQAPQYIPPQPQASQYIPQQQQAPQYIPPQAPPYAMPRPQMYNQPQMAPGYAPYYKSKSKVAAGLLGIFLGGLGIHKFYTGHVGLGFVYILFCWTYIPLLVGFIEGIIYLASSEETFNMKYVKHK